MYRDAPSLPPHPPHVSPLSCAASSSNSSVVIDGSGVAGGGDTERVGGGGGGAGGGGCATIDDVLVVLPLPKSYTQVLNHFRPILEFVPALTSDAR